MSDKPEEKKPKYKDGPWIRVEADALTSKTAGRVDLGSYWEPSEVDSGVLFRRIAALTAQGYQNITTRHISKDAE
jgi:hypothetical protein